MHKFRTVYLIIGLFLSFSFVKAQNAFRDFGGYYTKERITNVRNNCQKYDWAQKKLLAAVEKANTWLSKSDLMLWNMIPGQDLPRTIDVAYEKFNSGSKFAGCLVCGDSILKYGNYPYDPDFENKPWKLTCPSCHSIFPTNDFSKYYASAIDEQGLFNPSKGDKSLLFNVNHPDPKDPLHKFGVDDGFGYKAANGRTYKYVGYYSWKYWRHIIDGLADLADAFLYTGDGLYARKAAILLDRIADVYPAMDWKPYAQLGWYHSDGGGGRGKIEGSIWETVLVQKLAGSYDKILSGTLQNELLFTFLQARSRNHQLPSSKGTRTLFVENVDNRILKTAFEAVTSGRIRGNQGMYQLTVAACAVALYTQPQTNEWLDWLFEPGGGSITQLMFNHFDHDGTSDEGAPSYAFIWGSRMAELAELLNNYPAYTKHDILNDFPQFKAAFTVAYRMAVLGKAIPNIGDNGATGLVSKQMANPDFIAKGYLFTRDSSLAIAAYRANGYSAKGLGLEIFSRDPEAGNREIRHFGEKSGPRPVGGYLMSGFGLALLESHTGSTGVAVASNYGRTKMHGHQDLLNFDLFAFNHWMAPDLGYPEFATNIPKRNEWTAGTISHNTVVVNKKPQSKVWGGHSKLFYQSKNFSVFKLDGKKAYPGIKDYTRTMFLIGGSEVNKVDSNIYIVDIFRVEGGQDHVYSFHGLPGKVTTTSLNLEVQHEGTYAGEKIPEGTAAKGFPPGYSFLYNIQKDEKPPASFMVDWKAQTGYRGITESADIHLRAHFLTPAQDVALARGAPPQNKPGNPKYLDYVLIHREGQDLKSTFVSVFEPYRTTPFIRSVERVDNDKDDQVIIKVSKNNGYVDYLLYNPLTKKITQVPNGLLLNGDIGYVKIKDEKAEQAVLINGSSLQFGKMQLSSEGVYTGKVLDLEKDPKVEGWLLVDTKLPADSSLIGEQIMIETKSERDASYRIHGVQREGDSTKIFCGPVSFVSGLKRKAEEGSGGKGDELNREQYLYDFEAGAVFRIASAETFKASSP